MRDRRWPSPLLIALLATSLAFLGVQAALAGGEPTVTLAASPTIVGAGTNDVSLAGTVGPAALEYDTNVVLEAMRGAATTFTPIATLPLGSSQTTFTTQDTPAESTRYRAALQLVPSGVSYSATVTVGYNPAITFAGPNLSVVNRVATVAGTVTPTLVGQTVTIRGRVGTTTRTLGTATTNAEGAFKFMFKPTTTGTWTLYALVGSNAMHRAASVTRSMLVYRIRTSATLACSPSLLRAGGMTKMTGAVSPTFAGRYVYVQRYSAGRWVAAGRATLTTASRCTLWVRPPVGTTRYRGYFPQYADCYASHSAARSVTAYRPSLTRASAWVSDATPLRYSNVTAYAKALDQYGKPLSGGTATFTWHFKTVTHTMVARTGTTGVATVTRYIAGATKGYRVVINVTVAWGGKSLSRTTSFVPY